MKLILVRNGETEENKQHIWQGHMPGHLSELGKEQAKKLALRFKDEKIDAIYTSDLKRAADTAKQIAKFHKKIPFHLTKELREYYLGAWEGKPREYRDLNNPPVDIESFEHAAKRVKSFLDKVYKIYKNDTVMFVGHNGINRSLIAEILHQPPESSKDLENLRNTAVCIFEIREDNNHKIICMNCTKHLN